MNILLIEDRIEDAILIKEMLLSYFESNAKLNLTHKSNLLSALEVLKNIPFDLILCDLDLPDSTGLNTFEAAYHQTPDTPIIVLTGNDNNDIALAAVKAGAQDYLSKNDINNKILYRAARYAIKRKQAELQLRESEERFRSIVETTHDWIWATDKNGKYTYVNPSIKNILGYNPEKFIGKSLFSLVHEKDLLKLKKAFFTTQLTQVTRGWTNLIVRRQHQNKSYHYLESNCVPIFNLKGDVIGYRGCDRDITERKQAEAWLHKQQIALSSAVRLSSIGEMASTISHELNQPLAAIANFCHGCIVKLESNQFSTEELLNVMKLATAQCERAGEIIHRMKNFVRQGTLYHEIADINKLAKKAVALIDYELREKMVNIKFELQEPLPLIEVDKVQIEQVIINLLRNAIEAMENNEFNKKQIIIQTLVINNRSLTVNIIDSGMGFSAENQNKLFDIYFTTKKTGMGMGLSICRTIIEAHGGGITAKNNLDNNGACFEFTLPLISPKASFERKDTLA